MVEYSEGTENWGRGKASRAKIEEKEESITNLLASTGRGVVQKPSPKNMPKTGQRTRVPMSRNH